MAKPILRKPKRKLSVYEMCWIAVTRKENILKTLYAQKDRGLDSVWFIDWQNIKKIIYKTYQEYRTWFKKKINPKLSNNLIVLHHRKATIWDVNIQNAHPFIWKKFAIVQNWTSKVFHEAYKDVYKWETDTEKLLHYIETRADFLEEVPEVISSLSKAISDEFWNIILVDYYGRYLFYTDWVRESYIDIDSEKGILNNIFSYEPNTNKWYEHNWYILFNNLGQIAIDTIWEKNKIKFYSYSNNYVYTNAWDYKQYTVSEILWLKEWDKDYYELDEFEQVEYELVKEYLSANLFSSLNKSKWEVLKDYLLYQYWVSTWSQFFIDYNFSYPYNVFYDAYDEVFNY